MLDLEPGRQDHLVQLFPVFHALCDATSSVAPVLADEKVHTQLLRCVYGVGYQFWNLRVQVRNSPFLFGIWHPYKHICHLVWKRYLPYCHWLVKGVEPEGTVVGVKSRLRSVEGVYAVVMEEQGGRVLGVMGLLRAMEHTLATAHMCRTARTGRGA